MKHRIRVLAFLLAVLFAFGCAFPVFAEKDGGSPYSPFAHAFDNVLGMLHDRIFRFLQDRLREKDVPTVEEYFNAEHGPFYPGTDGWTQGAQWMGAFACGSVIPPSWRCDANGNSDPNGFCLRSVHGTGGYIQNKLKRIYSDQRLSLFILSNGSDANENGVPDLTIFTSADGVGITSDTCFKMRAAVEQALAPLGVTAQDIVWCSVSATHCHNALDTQGMAIRRVAQCLLTGQKQSLEPEMENALVTQAGNLAAEAFRRMERGSLFFFETDKVDGAHDDLYSGVKLKNNFSCLLFEGEERGEKTILANLAAHPVAYSRNSGDMLYTDYPYYMALAMEDAGFNFLFVQSAQATVCGPGMSCEAGSARDEEADAWLRQHTLSFDDWVERYGKRFADRYYDRGTDYGQEEFERHIKTAYLLAHFILDAAPTAAQVEPVLRIRNTRTLLKLDNGVMALGCISGILHEQTVLAPDAESGYGVITEIGCMEIGDNIAILSAPGELSPALLLGSDPEYTGNAKWTGVTSWTGEEWAYDTLEQIVRDATGDPQKTVLLFGITNDALGYVYPDVCATQSILGGLCYKLPLKDKGDIIGAMLLTTGCTSGSQLTESYIRLLEK
ncbi:MAG: hypothetical protein IJT44_04245 [Clostridia bacterium]|nr:hypothetical protein [Clostridia bacterium]